MMCLISVAHRNLRATIGVMDSCYLSPENDSSETHCGGSKTIKPIEN
jgi:hypothetical protein